MTTFLNRYVHDQRIGLGGELYLSWPVSRSDFSNFFLQEFVKGEV